MKTQGEYRQMKEDSVKTEDIGTIIEEYENLTAILVGLISDPKFNETFSVEGQKINEVLSNQDEVAVIVRNYYMSKEDE